MKLITIKELSEYLKIKESTLYSWTSSGMIPSYKLNGLLRFDKDEIEEWIKTKKIEPFDSKQKLKLFGLQRKNIDVESIIRRAINDVKNKKSSI